MQRSSAVTLEETSILTFLLCQLHLTKCKEPQRGLILNHIQRRWSIVQAIILKQKDYTNSLESTEYWICVGLMIPTTIIKFSTSRARTVLRK